MKRAQSPPPELARAASSAISATELSAEVNPVVPTPSQAPRPAKKPRVHRKKFKEPKIDPISTEGILLTDIRSLLKRKGISEESTWNDMEALFARPRDQPSPDHKVVEVKIEAISSVGDGIGILSSTEASSSPRIVVVPYALEGETVQAKIYKTNKRYFDSELVEVVEKSPLRNDDLIRCKYFAKCSGCNYQMLPYNDQLEVKRQVIVNAFKHYAQGITAQVPQVLPTVGSPLEYNYRTKITPHFDLPRRGAKQQGEIPPIGFGVKGRRAVLDIEECSIATQILNASLTTERKRVADTIQTFKRGATLLLRESSDPEEKDKRVCVTSTKEIITEFVGDYQFRYPSSQFFQNNNSILPSVTSYVKENITLPSSGKPPKYLVDTYCGSGLFGITCSSAVENVLGVEISKDSVEYARQNAELNKLSNAKFIVGQAEKIFELVNHDPSLTSVIIDPPRKGCDKLFLDQLLEFKPAKLVYVSCNVHSQARDIEYLLQNSDKANYKIDSIRGFDFFPQTHHVESVAVLSLC